MFSSERWLGGTIPIFFHIILALFIITIGIYQEQYPEDGTIRPAFHYSLMEVVKLKVLMRIAN